MKPNRHVIAVACVLVFAAVSFVFGIDWGLPSRAADKFLLREPAYSMRIEQLTSTVPEVDSTRGADVVSPGGAADQGVALNESEIQKARILCRYRLYSFQPDEMVTFRSLSQMRPSAGDLDPRLYQYGGLWIYGVGGLIEAGRALGLLSITDRATYIGNPELFGRFYIAARAYSAAFGIVGAWAVFTITRRLAVSRVFVPLMAALAFAIMPVVVIMAHEAKPHLAAAVLILLAVLAADNYLRDRKFRWLLITGVLCGCAAGMVLWGFVAIVVIITTGVFSRRAGDCLIAAAAAGVVYAFTNPYVIYHLFTDRTVLAGNLSNTSAMYHLGRPDLAAMRAVQLSIAGASPLIFLAGAVGIAVGMRRVRAPLAWLLAAVSVAAAIPYILFAAGKPGEYGRFALLPDIALLIAAAANLRAWRLAPGLPVFAAVFGHACLAGFIRDAGPPQQTSRWKAAVELQSALDSYDAEYERLRRAGRPAPPAPKLGMAADPAPYNLPPVDLTGWQMLRLAAGHDPAAADVFVTPIEPPWLSLSHNPISWADKQFEIDQRATP